MTTWAISYPSGDIYKDGVRVVGDLSEWVAFLTSGGTPEVLQDPTQDTIMVTLGQMLRAFEQANPSAYQAILDNIYYMSDDANLGVFCDMVGMSAEDRYATFQLAQTL